MAFEKETLDNGGTLSADTISSSSVQVKVELTKGLHAWGGDNLTHGNPGLFDLIGAGGTEIGTVEAGGIAHFKARATVTVTH